MDLILDGFLNAFTISTIIYVALGVFLGLGVGAIPGLSGAMAIAIGTPLTYSMAPITAIGFLIGINKGGAYGSSLSAILLNTPGSTESAATVFDGYPLCQQGKAMKAIKISLIASCFGDVFSTLLVIAIAAPIASFTLGMGPSEIFSLLVFSLALIAALESTSLTKGLLAISIGMFLSLIGMDPVLGESRLTFGIINLEAGINLVGLAIGMLALSELIVQTEKEVDFECIDGAAVTFSKNPEDNNVSLTELKSIARPMLQGSLIGSVIGALPGLGAAVAGFLSYGMAKKSSKHPEKFGHGSLEGIAAPESANNAVLGSALIPLFTLGIPGNVATAILIGAFVLHGVQPGPLMFEQHGEMVYGIYGAMVIGNIALLVIGYYGTQFFAKLLCFPRIIILPVIMFICLMGAYFNDSFTFSVGIMVVCAVVGYFLKKIHLSFVCFIVGFILGPMLELSLQQMLITYSDDLTTILTRPATVIIWIGIIGFIAWQIISSFKTKKV